MMKRVFSNIIILISFLGSLFAQDLKEEGMEKLYISTDRDIYFPLDQVFVKLWVLGEGNEKISRLAYIEFLSEENEVIDQKITGIENRGGAVIFTIPSGLPSGFYVIRAYTHYLKSLGVNYFAYKKIMVINPAIDNSFNYPEKRNLSGKSIHAEFFPEGGNIIKGISNRIYIQFENLPDDALFDAYVTGSFTDTVSLIEIIDEKKKTAFFDIVPYNEDYELRLPAVYPHRPLKVPESKSMGVKLRLRESINSLIFNVESTDTTLKLEDLKIQVWNNNRKGDSEITTIDIGQEMIFKMSELPFGMNRFSLVDENSNTLSTLYYFKKNEDHFRIQVEGVKEEVGPRQNLDLSIQTNSANGEPVSAIINVLLRKKSETVFHHSTLKDFYNSAAILHLNPEWVSGKSMTDRCINAIYGSRLFESGDEYSDQPFSQSDKFLIHGMLKNGKINDQKIYLSLPGDSSQLFITRTNDKGEFVFPVTTEFGRKEIFLKTEDSIQEGYLSIQNHFYPDYFKMRHFPELFDSLKILKINQYFQNWHINRIYDFKEKINADPAILPGMYYDKADFYLSMDNYVELPNMEEVFFEIVKPVMILRQNRKPYLKVIDRVTNRTIGDRPLYVIDGVPFTNPDYAFGLTPSNVRDVSVVARRYFIGNEFFDGIIIINTRSNNLTDIDPEMDYLRQSYVFPERQSSYDIKFQPEGNHLPFAPPTIYWNSSMITGSDGVAEFSIVAPDLPGEYEICIEGLNEINGYPGYTIQEFLIQ